MTIECDICGHAYPQSYMTETEVGEGTTQETITHCRGGHCATDEAHQDLHAETLAALGTERECHHLNHHEERTS
jgi:hypothetical protein